MDLFHRAAPNYLYKDSHALSSAAAKLSRKAKPQVML